MFSQYWWTVLLEPASQWLFLISDFGVEQIYVVINKKEISFLSISKLGLKESFNWQRKKKLYIGLAKLENIFIIFFYQNRLFHKFSKQKIKISFDIFVCVWSNSERPWHSNNFYQFSLYPFHWCRHRCHSDWSHAVQHSTCSVNYIYCCSVWPRYGCLGHPLWCHRNQWHHYCTVYKYRILVFQRYIISLGKPTYKDPSNTIHLELFLRDILGNFLVHGKKRRRENQWVKILKKNIKNRKSWTFSGLVIVW